jgi:O-acetyl-ADP-ribose deacetylase
MTLLNKRVETLCADITSISCDAVVNAANSSLLGGGGVDGAIHRAAGPQLLEECREIRKEQYPEGLPAGEAVITNAGGMNCSRVIHTVGPVWKGGGCNESETLASCYSSSLVLAEKEKLRIVAFPAISTGIYGYPPEKAALIVYKTMKNFLPEFRFPEKILLVFFSQNGEDLFLNGLLNEPEFLK